MKSVNRALEDKYWELLTAAMPVAGFINYSGRGEVGDAYWDITIPSNSDISTKQSNDTDTSVQVAIYTRKIVANPGIDIDTLAGIVLNVIYPTPLSTIDIPGFQITSTSIGSDVNQQPFLTDTEIYINRIITFRHKIFHYL